MKEKGGKPDMVEEIHTDTSSLRTLRIMPRNLNEIVCLNSASGLLIKLIQSANYAHT
jgi:hypothetical protein